jgi:hypothetical protein
MRLSVMAAALALGGAAVGLVWYATSPVVPVVTPDSATVASAPAPAPLASQQQLGAGTPAAAVVPAPAAASAHPVSAVAGADPIGVVTGVRKDLNPQVALVASALTQHDHPERLSALVQPPAFVPGSDPAAYAADVAPGRAFQSATPGPGVPVLSAVGPTQLTMDQDGHAYLRVRSKPNSPVTFTSFDLGSFSNSLATQTVVADANGVASVAFSAGPGTIDGVHILAGSPGATGQVPFVVTVSPSARGLAAATAPASAPIH